MDKFIPVVVIRELEEVDEIARRIKENRAVVVNLHKLTREYAQRTMSEYVLNGLGSFAGMVELPEGYKNDFIIMVKTCSRKFSGFCGENRIDFFFQLC